MFQLKNIPICLILLVYTVWMPYLFQASVLPTNTIMDNQVQLAPIIGTKQLPTLNHPLSANVTSRLSNLATRTTLFIPLKDVVALYDINPNEVTNAVELFKHHVVPEALLTSSITETDKEWKLVSTMARNGLPVALSRDSSTNIMRIKSSAGFQVNVVKPDILCSNGIIHIVDGVLEVAGQPSFHSLSDKSILPDVLSNTGGIIHDLELNTFHANTEEPSILSNFVEKPINSTNIAEFSIRNNIHPLPININNGFSLRPTTEETKADNNATAAASITTADTTATTTNTNTTATTTINNTNRQEDRPFVRFSIYDDDNTIPIPEPLSLGIDIPSIPLTIISNGPILDNSGNTNDAVQDNIFNRHNGITNTIINTPFVPATGGGPPINPAAIPTPTPLSNINFPLNPFANSTTTLPTNPLNTISPVGPARPVNSVNPINTTDNLLVNSINTTNNNLSVNPINAINNLSVNPINAINNLPVNPINAINNLPVNPINTINNLPVNPINTTNNNLPVNSINAINNLPINPINAINNLQANPISAINNLPVNPINTINNNLPVNPISAINNLPVNPINTINNNLPVNPPITNNVLENQLNEEKIDAAISTSLQGLPPPLSQNNILENPINLHHSVIPPINPHNNNTNTTILLPPKLPLSNTDINTPPTLPNINTPPTLPNINNTIPSQNNLNRTQQYDESVLGINFPYNLLGPITTVVPEGEILPILPTNPLLLMSQFVQDSLNSPSPFSQLLPFGGAPNNNTVFTLSNDEYTDDIKTQEKKIFKNNITIDPIQILPLKIDPLEIPKQIPIPNEISPIQSQSQSQSVPLPLSQVHLPPEVPDIQPPPNGPNIERPSEMQPLPEILNIQKPPEIVNIQKPPEIVNIQKPPEIVNIQKPPEIVNTQRPEIPNIQRLEIPNIQKPEIPNIQKPPEITIQPPPDILNINSNLPKSPEPLQIPQLNYQIPNETVQPQPTLPIQPSPAQSSPLEIPLFQGPEINIPFPHGFDQELFKNIEVDAGDAKKPPRVLLTPEEFESIFQSLNSSISIPPPHPQETNKLHNTMALNNLDINIDNNNTPNIQDINTRKNLASFIVPYTYNVKHPNIDNQVLTFTILVASIEPTGMQFRPSINVLSVNPIVIHNDTYYVSTLPCDKEETQKELCLVIPRESDESVLLRNVVFSDNSSTLHPFIVVNDTDINHPINANRPPRINNDTNISQIKPIPPLNTETDISLKFFESLLNQSADISDTTLRLHDILYNHNEQVNIQAISGFINRDTSIFVHPLTLPFSKPLCASTKYFSCSSFYLCPIDSYSICIHPTLHQKVCYDPMVFTCNDGVISRL